MKDEEIAKQFADSHTHYEVAKREDGTEYAKKVSDVTIEQAFLAGLKAGRPQWHDLEKDPTDLPKGQINRYLFGYVKNYRGKKPMLISYNGEWFYDANTYNTEVKVIAWCEIPTLDKE